MDSTGPSRDHLWLHFTAHGRLRGRAEVPIIVRGDGCYLEDVERQALPGRARRDSSASTSATASARRWVRRPPRRCASCPSTSTGRTLIRARSSWPPRWRSSRPGDLNRVFFVSGGSEAVEAAWKLARQYHAARGERRWKAIARRIAYHGTTMGALSINGITALQDAVRAAGPRRDARPEHEPLPPPGRGDRGGVHALPARRPGGDDHAGGARRRSRW